MLHRPGVTPVPQEVKLCCLADGAQAAAPAYQALHPLVHSFMSDCVQRCHSADASGGQKERVFLPLFVRRSM